MAKRSAALRVVDKEPPPKKGDDSLTRATMAEWKAGQRICRARKRHNWGPFMVWEHRTFLEVVEQCSHCRNRRSAEFTHTSYGLRKSTPWRPLYRDGYLLPPGAMALDDDLNDELTAADILSRKTVEVPDEEDDE